MKTIKGIIAISKDTGRILDVYAGEDYIRPEAHWLEEWADCKQIPCTITYETNEQ